MEQVRKTLRAYGQPEPEDLPDRRGPPPPGTEYLWGYFADLDESRGAGMVPERIPYSEIESFCRMRHIDLEQWEINALRAIDRVRLEVYGRHSRAANQD